MPLCPRHPNRLGEMPFGFGSNDECIVDLEMVDVWWDDTQIHGIDGVRSLIHVVGGHDEYDRVLTAMGQLSDRDQEILRLAAYEDLDHQSIGQVIGVRGSLVRTLLYRARRRLNAALADAETRQPTASEHIHGEQPLHEANPAAGVENE